MAFLLPATLAILTPVFLNAHIAQIANETRFQGFVTRVVKSLAESRLDLIQL